MSEHISRALEHCLSRGTLPGRIVAVQRYGDAAPGMVLSWSAQDKAYATADKQHYLLAVAARRLWGKVFRAAPQEQLTFF